MLIAKAVAAEDFDAVFVVAAEELAAAFALEAEVFVQFPALRLLLRFLLLRCNWLLTLNYQNEIAWCV